jgi:hypothetical protein
MPVDYYPNKSIEDLSQLLTTLQKRQTEGTLTEVSAAGVRTVKTLSPGNARVEVELRRVLYSLYVRAKGTDQAADYPNPYDQMIRRTRPRYSGAAFS